MGDAAPPAAVAGASIRRRVLTLALSAVALVWLGAAIYSYVDVQHETGEMLDGYLAQSAALIAAQASENLEEIDVEHAAQLHKYARRVAFQLWDRGRILRLHSVNAPNTRLSQRDSGFDDVVIDGRPWRVSPAGTASGIPSCRSARSAPRAMPSPPLSGAAC